MAAQQDAALQQAVEAFFVEAAKLRSKYGAQLVVAVARPLSGQHDTRLGVRSVECYATEHLQDGADQLAMSAKHLVNIIAASWTAARLAASQPLPLGELVLEAAPLVRATAKKVLLLAMPNRKRELPWTATSTSLAATTEQVLAPFHLNRTDCCLSHAPPATF
jgi:hypothetical protein